MGRYQLVDADCHILEPPDIWQNWLKSRGRNSDAKAATAARLGSFSGKSRRR